MSDIIRHKAILLRDEPRLQAILPQGAILCGEDPVEVYMATDYARLEQECERLQAIIDSALEQFPFNADRQKFTFNGQEVTADGDDLFYGVKRVNAFLCEVHDALSAKP